MGGRACCWRSRFRTSDLYLPVLRAGSDVWTQISLRKVSFRVDQAVIPGARILFPFRFLKTSTGASQTRRTMEQHTLNPEQALAIFSLKPNNKYEKRHGAIKLLADKFKVSPKAIRDVWTGRSWLKATFDLWSDDDRPVPNPPGRPKGSKDKNPRKQNNQHKPLVRSTMSSPARSRQSSPKPANQGLDDATDSGRTNHPRLSMSFF